MESPQSTLFHERFEDALDEIVRATGGRKKVAGILWPDKSARDAHNMIDACLNPDRRERFTPSQVLFLLRRGFEAKCHAGMEYLGRELGYEVRVVSPEERREHLVAVVKDATSTLSDALERLERLGMK